MKNQAATLPFHAYTYISPNPLDTSIPRYYNHSRHCNQDCAICIDAARTDFGTIIRCRSSSEGMCAGVVNFQKEGF